MDHRVRLRTEYRSHLWSCDFVHHRTADGRAFRTLNIPDGHSRECPFSADLAVPNRLPGNGTIRAKRKPNSTEVIDALTDLFILRGVPAYIRSDNGPEFIAGAVRDWIKAVRAKTAYIEPRSPRENGYCASFNRRMRDELLNGEIFYPLREARIIVERCRTKRPHSAPGYRPPGPEALIPMEQRPIMHQLSNRTTQVGRQSGVNLVTLLDNNPECTCFPPGTLDDDPRVKPAMHVYTASSAPFYDIHDGLPRWEEVPES